MSLSQADLARLINGFPRVSGDEPSPYAKYRWFPGFSPRERG